MLVIFHRMIVIYHGRKTRIFVTTRNTYYEITSGLSIDMLIVIECIRK